MMSDNFLAHFRIGEALAYKHADGAGGAGILLGADELGVYLSLDDGGTTFEAWRSISHAWDGPLAEQAIHDRAARLAARTSHQRAGGKAAPDA